MRSVPFVLRPMDEESFPAESRLDPETTFRAEGPNGAIRFDASRVGRVASAQKLEWLWPNRIPVKQVTLIEGATGAGKSFVALDIAARATRGLPWPDAVGPGNPDSVADGPVNVLFIGSQDDDATIGRRLESLGADMQRIRQFRNFLTYDPEKMRHEERSLALPHDLPAIEKELEEHEAGIGLIVIDPLSDFCSGPQQLAEALRQLSELARNAYVAIVVTLPAQTRFDVQGAPRVSSRWRTDAARCVWTVAADPDDHTRRLFFARRINFCQEPRGLAFRVVDGQVVWDPESAIDPVDPLGQRKAIDACLNEVLRDGCAPAPDVFRLGSQCGFNQKQLRAAGKRLGIESHKGAGFGAEGGYLWSTREYRMAVSARLKEASSPANLADKLEAPAESRTIESSPDSTDFPGRSTLEAETAPQKDNLAAEVAKNEESLENYREIWDSVWSDMARDGRGNRPPTATRTARRDKHAQQPR
jgi:hypothetical protein